MDNEVVKYFIASFFLYSSCFLLRANYYPIFTELFLYISVPNERHAWKSSNNRERRLKPKNENFLLITTSPLLDTTLLIAVKNLNDTFYTFSINTQKSIDEKDLFLVRFSKKEIFYSFFSFNNVL